MKCKLNSLRQAALIFILAAGSCGPIHAEPTDDSNPPEDEGWTRVVRSSPYWTSQGVYSNILTVRQWVLKSSGYCSDVNRHILFDLRGRFLAWMSDGNDRTDTQIRLNDIRRSLHDDGRAETWVAGGSDITGYPFALACDQPHVDLNEAIARYLGTLPADRIWGAWDDLAFASSGQPGSLHEALLYVYGKRMEQQRLQLPTELPVYLAGQLLIESGGQARAHSGANARGILQLSPSALSDCQIKPRNYWHRLAQIDCALKLMNQNARNLGPAFEERFGHLPEDKRNRLFTLLLIQAYHGGAGRVESLISDDLLSRPARYFAEHQERFTAGDIAFGMVFHNLGRDRLGLASLYYVADVELATRALCRTNTLNASEFCKWN
ncbi:lytic transglycosylase domain-containing protein [Marinobacter salinexigens]|uniref:Lytic transglycosylase domain-containing protein n=1 Tax=Marinobacter salinexigens TaxID=2919747 RepID=A0A5B0VJ45_9GAMM|nr:transglycosylase SLT domain-containing protein [Marinobacter salinexigens]KAA1174293.1 lytic transglycosylase domain-containing protein [Marinobacter salinexigens]